MTTRRKKRSPCETCPQASEVKYCCLGFTFSGEERLGALVELLATHPELIRRQKPGSRWRVEH